ncbi:MAG: hypothetical protein WBD31_29315 [Rubripirellula sp.]
MNRSHLAVALAAFLISSSIGAQEPSAAIANVDLVFQEVDGIVAVEAEHFVVQEKTEIRAWCRTDEMRVPEVKPDFDGVHLMGSSGACYLEALPDSRATHDDKITVGENFFSQPGQAGVLTYQVEIIHPGRYYVWVRHLSTGSEDNGIHVGLDGSWPESGKDWQTTKKRKWAWESRQRTKEVHTGVRHKLYLDITEPGEHRIHFSVREDGFEFDKFVLASDRDYEPQGAGPDPVVSSGTMPAAKTLSRDYTEAPIPATESKVKDAAKVGYRYKASQSPQDAIAMTQPIANSGLVFNEIGGIVAVEAEHFLSQEKGDVRAWFRVKENEIHDVQPDLDTPHLHDASGGSYLEALPDSRWSHGQTLVYNENFFDDPGLAGVLTYNVHFTQPGRYYVWVRHYSTNSEDNGMHVGLNGQWPESGQRWQTIIKRRWAWESRQRTEEAHDGVPFELYLDIPSAGQHQIHFSIREDGLEFDKFVLALDRDYRPDGLGPTSAVHTGTAPPPKTLSASYVQADMPDAAPTPLVALPEATVRVPAPQFNIDGSDFYVDQKTWLAINPNQARTATASAKIAAADGTYTVIFHAVGENDGESKFDIKIGDQPLGSFTCPMSLDTFELGSKFTKAFSKVAIKQGETIEVTATIGSADGSEFSRGRWMGVTFLPATASAEQLDSAQRSFPDVAASDNAKPKAKTSSRAKQSNSVQPPAGRLAIVADGNSPDPDDIGATAVIFGLLNASGLNDRLVHLSHSCDLKPAARIAPADELRRQKVLHEICDDGVAKYGPFANLAGHFNCRTDQQAAVDDLRNAINASSKTDPLWIIEAGEPDIIGYALQAADADKRAHVHVVSHHPANDNTGDFFSWQQILDFGVTEHQIGDQNVYLKANIPPWDWAKDHADARIQWIWKQLAYAEQDGVVKFQTGHFDCSDAGMVYWWITGADGGGNKVATPVEIKSMLTRSGQQ